MRRPRSAAPFVGFPQDLSMSTGANPQHPDYRDSAAAIEWHAYRARPLARL